MFDDNNEESSNLFTASPIDGPNIGELVSAQLYTYHLTALTQLGLSNARVIQTLAESRRLLADTERAANEAKKELRLREQIALEEAAQRNGTDVSDNGLYLNGDYWISGEEDSDSDLDSDSDSDSDLASQGDQPEKRSPRSPLASSMQAGLQLHSSAKPPTKVRKQSAAVRN